MGAQRMNYTQQNNDIKADSDQADTIDAAVLVFLYGMLWLIASVLAYRWLT
jgi:hypothetical protein